MIAMTMADEDELYVREVGRGDARLDRSSHAAEPAAEHRVARDREPLVAEDHGGVTAKRDGELARRWRRDRIARGSRGRADPARDPVTNEAAVPASNDDREAKASPMQATIRSWNSLLPPLSRILLPSARPMTSDRRW